MSRHRGPLFDGRATQDANNDRPLPAHVAARVITGPSTSDIAARCAHCGHWPIFRRGLCVADNSYGHPYVPAPLRGLQPAAM